MFRNTPQTNEHAHQMRSLVYFGFSNQELKMKCFLKLQQAVTCREKKTVTALFFVPFCTSFKKTGTESCQIKQTLGMFQNQR